MPNLDQEIRNLQKKVAYVKKQLSARRPFSQAELRELDSYFRTTQTYSSNALEGNTLTLLETKLALEDGITVAGKRLSEYAEALGHAEAYDFMLIEARKKNLCFTEELVKKLHYVFSKNLYGKDAGEYRNCQVFISTGVFIPPSPADVPGQMKKFIKDLNFIAETKDSIEAAAFAHRELVTIHPFIDGNGRTARLLMNLILIHDGYYPVPLHESNRHLYYQTLIAAQREENPDDRPFTKFIYEQEFEALKDVCRLFHIPYKEIQQDND